MKRLNICILAIIMLMCAACGSKQAQNSETEQSTTIEPQETQVRNICELATMECYYHNVAKYDQSDAEGYLFWKKDKKFWVEYSGTVTIGIDVSRVKINFDKNSDLVTITLPPAKVMDCSVDEDSLSVDSYILDPKSASITAEDETKAFSEAQETMRETAAGDTALLEMARDRAKKLLEDYIKNIGDAAGKKFDINWEYLDDAVGAAEMTETEVTGR